MILGHHRLAGWSERWILLDVGKNGEDPSAWLIGTGTNVCVPDPLPAPAAGTPADAGVWPDERGAARDLQFPLARTTGARRAAPITARIASARTSGWSPRSTSAAAAPGGIAPRAMPSDVDCPSS